MNCIVCNSGNVQRIKLKYPLIRHLDFNKIFDSGILYHCQTCFNIRFSPTKSEPSKISAIYQSNNYIDNKKTSHVSFEENAGGFLTTYNQIVDFLLGTLNKACPKILDVGCFDFKLLIDAANKAPTGDYWGFEVAQGYKKYLPANAATSIHFVHDLNDIDEKFDVISLINVLLYVENIDELFRQFERLLAPDGFIYVENPDLAVNPLTVLYGDLFNIYSQNNIRNLFAKFGYSVEFVENKWALRSLSLVARRQSAPPARNDFQYDNSLQEALAYIESMKKVVQEFGGKQFKVLGTTMNAAVVSHLFGPQVHSFVDENPAKLNTKFYEKQVHHPESLTPEDILLIPYGKTSGDIIERFKKKNYRARMISI